MTVPMQTPRWDMRRHTDRNLMFRPPKLAAFHDPGLLTEWRHRNPAAIILAAGFEGRVFAIHWYQGLSISVSVDAGSAIRAIKSAGRMLADWEMGA